jgi:hypothetical protein
MSGRHVARAARTMTIPGATNIHASSGLLACRLSLAEIDARLADIVPHRALDPRIAAEVDALLATRYAREHPERG